MKTKVQNILVTCALMAFLCNVSYASEYTVDNASIDALIANAVEIGVLESSLPYGVNETNATLSSKDPWVAFAVCFIVGGFGVHRHYLGTKSGMWAIYTFTCGGIFGIVTFVDWVVLLVGAINEDIAKYVGNPDFFMWL